GPPSLDRRPWRRLPFCALTLALLRFQPPGHPGPGPSPERRGHPPPTMRARAGDPPRTMAQKILAARAGSPGARASGADRADFVHLEVDQVVVARDLARVRAAAEAAGLKRAA